MLEWLAAAEEKFRVLMQLREGVQLELLFRLKPSEDGVKRNRLTTGEVLY